MDSTNYPKLASARLFEGMTAEDPQVPLADGGIARLDKDDILLREGRCNDHRYVVPSGELQVRIERVGESRTELGMAARDSDDGVGEFSFFHGRPAPTTPAGDGENGAAGAVGCGA